MLKFVLFRTKHVSYRSRPSTRNNNSILFYKLKLDKKRPPENQISEPEAKNQNFEKKSQKNLMQKFSK